MDKKISLLALAAIVIAIGGFAAVYTVAWHAPEAISSNTLDRGLDTATDTQAARDTVLPSEAADLHASSAASTSAATAMVAKKDSGTNPASSTAMQRIPADKTTDTVATALLADGCFWSTQRDLEEVTGVISTVAGYADGSAPSPNYQNYVAGGYREAVLVTYNPQIVSYANLVEHIIKHGDPTDPNGSFYDRGPEYVPAIYYSTEAEHSEALQVIAAVNAKGVFAQPLPLLVIPKGTFYPAEDYHQDFAKKNPFRYNTYRLATGRDAFIQEHWGGSADIFTITQTPS
jgi:methionine-S-sulfoxide reductase